MLTVPLACIAAYTRVTRVSYTQFRRILHAFDARVTLDEVTRSGYEISRSSTQNPFKMEKLNEIK